MTARFIKKAFPFTPLLVGLVLAVALLVGGCAYEAAPGYYDTTSTAVPADAAESVSADSPTCELTSVEVDVVSMNTVTILEYSNVTLHTVCFWCVLTNTGDISCTE